MKQLTIYCIGDLEAKVVTALDEAGCEGFVHIGDVTGHKFAPRGQVPRTIAWEALKLVIPAATEEQVDSIVCALRGQAESCDTDRCLRIVSAPVEQVW